MNTPANRTALVLAIATVGTLLAASILLLQSGEAEQPRKERNSRSARAPEEVPSHIGDGHAPRIPVGPDAGSPSEANDPYSEWLTYDQLPDDYYSGVKEFLTHAARAMEMSPLPLRLEELRYDPVAIADLDALSRQWKHELDQIQTLAASEETRIFKINEVEEKGLVIRSRDYGSLELYQEAVEQLAADLTAKLAEGWYMIARGGPESGADDENRSEVSRLVSVRLADYPDLKFFRDYLQMLADKESSEWRKVISAKARATILTARKARIDK